MDNNIIRGKSLTFAYVDCPDDCWRWCIVTDYLGCQDYGEVICAFADDYSPTPEQVKVILESLERLAEERNACATSGA